MGSLVHEFTGSRVHEFTGLRGNLKIDLIVFEFFHSIHRDSNRSSSHETCKLANWTKNGYDKEIRRYFLLAKSASA